LGVCSLEGRMSIRELEDTQPQSHQNWLYPLAMIPMYAPFLAIYEGPSKVNKFGLTFNPRIPKSKARQNVTLFLFCVRSTRRGLMLLLPQTCLATQGFPALASSFHRDVERFEWKANSSFDLIAVLRAGRGQPLQHSGRHK